MDTSNTPPMKELTAKVAFVTGGSSGIGLGIARACLRAGMKVVIGYRSQAHLDEASGYFARERNRFHAIQVDVTDRSGMQKAAEEAIKVFGKIHVLVNNAGVQNPLPLSQMGDEGWDRLIGTNLTGVFNGLQAFLPRIRAHGEGGQIVSIASILGLVAVGPGYGAYCASKFAVVGLMEALRAELSSTNIGVSVCCPGVVRSNLEKDLKDDPVASDPYEVGELVVEGIHRNALYILTHPEFASLIRARSEALFAAVPQEMHPTPLRVETAHAFLRSSIYVSESHHHRCTDAKHVED